MIDLPPKKPLLPKICKDCNIPVSRDNGILRQGYLIRQCKECNKKQSKRYADKKKKAQQEFKEWYG